MPKSKDKCLSCRQFIMKNCNNFNLKDFYEYYNFPSKRDAESAFKNATFWEKKNAQYQTLQASYVHKQLQSSASIEVEKSVLADLNENNTRFSNKRSFDAAEEYSRKRTKRATQKKKEKKKKEDEKDFMEINATNVAELKIHKLKKNLSVEERLALSSIKVTNQEKLPQYRLSDNSYALIKRWKKAIDDKEELFLQQPPPENREEMAIANTLSTLLLSNEKSTRKTGGAVRHRYSQSEIDFIIEIGSVLVQNTFDSSNKISVDWHRSGLWRSQASKKKNKALVDIDRARIAEICKRQLHLRLQASSSTKEHCTFGILVGEIGMVLDFTKLEFNNGEYNYSTLKTVELPERKNVGGSIEEILESLYSFKKTIEQSLPSEEEKSSALSFDQFSEMVKPTIRFLK
ncbi:hypothetical protein CLU79DRAFT_716010 [Phycomyces nitens]|nr:hypothetical protein CLU79DRAFT_716010 [Phycomyces nitens]